MANYPIYRLVKGTTLSFTEMDGNLEWLSRNMSASVVTITGSTFLLGNLTVTGGITGSLFGTSSWAVSASNAVNSISASYVSGSGAIVTNLSSSNDANINGLTVGRGYGNQPSNTIIGYQSFKSINSTVYGNVTLGADTMGISTTGSYNTAIGQGAGYRVTGDENTLIGNGVTFALTTGGYNTAVGTNAGNNLSTGNYNTFLGRRSGFGITTGNYNTVIGAMVSGLSNPSNNIILADGQGNIKYRWDTTQNNIYGNLYINGGSITGSDALFTGTITAQTIVAQTITSSTEWITGSSKFGSLVTDTHQFTGSLLAASITGSLQGTSSWAISASWAPSSNVAVIASYIATGSVTASVNTDISASFRVISGSNTLLNVTRDGFVWIGNGSFTNAGYQLDIVGGNARINGLPIGIGNSSSTTNTAFGLNAMYLATVTGLSNTAIGRNALRYITNGEYNTAIGEGTSANLTSGTRNTVVGGGSGNIVAGTNNTVVGAFAGTGINGGSGNIFIGYTAGYVLNGVSNILSINSKTLTDVDEPNGAIIYGVQASNLNNQILTLNARVAVMTTASNASAQFQVDSTTRGFLPTRTDLTSNISNPAQGLITYVTASSTEGLWYYNSGSIKAWTRVLNDTGSQAITGSLTVTQGITGSHFGTSSWAVSASWAPSAGGGTTLNGSGYVSMSGTTVAYVSAIPNTSLANSSITVQGSTIVLGGSANIINGTGFVKSTGTTISYDNSSYYSSSNPNGYTSNAGTLTSVTVTAGTGMSGGGTLTGAGGTVTLTNAAPDQTVVLNNGTGISVTGTYPNFTITATGGSLSGGKTNYNTIWSSATTVSTGSIYQYSATQIVVTGSSLAVGNIIPSVVAGRIDASNDIVSFSTSDIRFKDNIKPIDNAISKVNQIRGVEFDWIKDETYHGNKGHDIGVIAQELEKVLPEVVTTRDSGYKAVKYDKIVALLIQAIKEQQSEIEELKSRIDGITK